MTAARKRIAIIGTGISGLGTAYLLNPYHDISIYEKNDYSGGHARTKHVRYDEQKCLAVDTGFIVFNYTNYPHLVALFHHLGVRVKKSIMSFGVTTEGDELEWSAENPNALFGQRRNLFRPQFYGFLWDVLRFNRIAVSAIRKNPSLTLGALVEELGLGDWFQRYYILPMGGAIWSCSLKSILTFPAKFFVEFFEKHGLLSVMNQPQWYTVEGGSEIYITKLITSFADKIKKSCGAQKVTRLNGKVQVTDVTGVEIEYDEIVFATHADETLALLADATEDEKKIFSAFRYQKNTAVLHKHEGIMPRRRQCWASWVYHADTNPVDAPIAVTYWMNHLQNIDKKYPLFVTLNPRTTIPEEDIFERHIFDHPIYDPLSVDAQAYLPRLQGYKNSWFCGAYHTSGFHEDGLASAVSIAKRMGIGIPWQ